MAVNITVTVPLATLTAFTSGDGRQQATATVTESVIKKLEAIPYNITPKDRQNGLHLSASRAGLLPSATEYRLQKLVRVSVESCPRCTSLSGSRP